MKFNDSELVIELIGIPAETQIIKSWPNTSRRATQLPSNSHDA